MKIRGPSIAIVLAALLVALSGCGKKDDTSNDNTTGAATGAAIDGTGNVYMVGYTGTDASASPCYWMNGKLVDTLSIGAGNTHFVVNQAFINTSTGDFFITGAVGPTATNLWPCYWKNGTLTILDYSSYTYGQAVGVTADGSGNVYFAGALGTSASDLLPFYWMNGVLTPLTLSSAPTHNTMGWANGVSRDSVTGAFFIVGAEGTSSTAIVPCYWAGTTSAAAATDLALDGAAYGYARGITVSGGMVYAAGARGSSEAAVVPCYWSGSSSGSGPGPATQLPITTNSYGYARSAVAGGGVVYLTGVQGTSSSASGPCYWTSTLSTTLLPVGARHTIYAAYWAVADTAGTLYTAGAVGAGTTLTPCYWNTGSLNLLPMGTHKGVEGSKGVATQSLW